MLEVRPRHARIPRCRSCNARGDRLYLGPGPRPTTASVTTSRGVSSNAEAITSIALPGLEYRRRRRGRAQSLAHDADMAEEELLTVEEAARRLRLSHETIRRWLRSGSAAYGWRLLELAGVFPLRRCAKCSAKVVTSRYQTSGAQKRWPPRRPSRPEQASVVNRHED